MCVIFFSRFKQRRTKNRTPCYCYFCCTISGFAGELCNYEYNECESNPCLNGGQCIDHISGFSCKCTAGYTGKRCHVKVKKEFLSMRDVIYAKMILK